MFIKVILISSLSNIGLLDLEIELAYSGTSFDVLLDSITVGAESEAMFYCRIGKFLGPYLDTLVLNSNDQITLIRSF